VTVRYPRHILGIDPGTTSLGWLLLEVPKSQSFKALDFGTIQPPRGDCLRYRFAYELEQLAPVIARAKELWAECVVERPFVNKNHMATLAIAGSRAIALAMIGQVGLRFTEYSPQSWKQITGSGSADAPRYTYVVQQLLRLRDTLPYDVGAAGGLAIYHGSKEEREDD